MFTSWVTPIPPTTVKAPVVVEVDSVPLLILKSFNIDPPLNFAPPVIDCA